MINPKQNLSENIFKKNIEQASTRIGFGEGLLIAGEKNINVVALSADLEESVHVNLFKEKFPQRFFETGVAEQAMITVSSGLANYGKIPFAASYSVFSPGRTWEQIRTTICINNVPVKIIGSHTGLTVGPDGATHQMLEDFALMRSLPNMIVISPCDAEEAKKATLEIAKNNKPSYLRLTRASTPVFTTDRTPFNIGKAETFWESKNPLVAIIATGPLVYESLLAAKGLQNRMDVLVINCHTIKPLDELAIIRAAKTCGAIITVEDHQINGGLGSAVAECLSKNFPTPIEMVAVEDKFGESGSPDELLEKYNLTKENIIEKVKKVIARKNS
ncbi:MAG TPA: transketolase C-terminal domain-containing protein [Patescibacteria group bacterium]|nr:transketolase C-terminal domain-containing protein [Patescibacteria group bacterium]